MMKKELHLIQNTQGVIAGKTVCAQSNIDPCIQKPLYGMVYMAKETMTSRAESDACATRFNHRDLLVGNIITMNEKRMIPQKPCFVKIHDGKKTRRLPVVIYSPY